MGEGNVALLPLLMKKTDTHVIRKHDVNLLRNVTKYVNPGQIPVLIFNKSSMIYCLNKLHICD